MAISVPDRRGWVVGIVEGAIVQTDLIRLGFMLLLAHEAERAGDEIISRSDSRGKRPLFIISNFENKKSPEW